MHHRKLLDNHFLHVDVGLFARDLYQSRRIVLNEQGVDNALLVVGISFLSVHAGQRRPGFAASHDAQLIDRRMAQAVILFAFR